MKNQEKKVFNLPYAGIEEDQGHALLYNLQGDYSVIFKISNLAIHYGANPAVYEDYHRLLINIIKILGEGHVIQKQDVFSSRKYVDKPAGDFLSEKYQAHFKGRVYLHLDTYLILTRSAKRNAFYVHDEKAHVDFRRNRIKIFELLNSANLSPKILSKKEINEYVKRVLAMEFSRENVSLDNLSADATGLKSAFRQIRSISLIDSDAIDMPESIGAFRAHTDGAGMKLFPMDNLFFLHQVPGVETMIYNQVISIPAQNVVLRKLDLKRKRHASIPDTANLICVSDIDRLMEEVARENQLLIYAHFNILICAKHDQIDSAANFIESELFQRGIIPSRNAYNQLELFRTVLPGNAAELKVYDWFLTTAEAAVCLFFKERYSESEHSDFLIQFCSSRGIPITVDLNDLPMEQGRISNRNKFVLGPSGSGKSFFMNALLQQYLQHNMDVVIVDTGHSYSGLCSYYGGVYFSYSEENPITMNPFLISEKEYNLEKKDFLKTLLALLLKGAGGTISQVEDSVFSNVIAAYYYSFFSDEGAINALCFDSFYDFSLLKIAEIKRKEHISFDLDEYRFVLKKFCSGGEFGQILNKQVDESLFSQRLIIFEIDVLKEHKVLFPIVTLIIMDVFLQKMRHRESQRKALILEEAWKAISSPLMANYILYLYKTIRKFYGEAIVVTQELGDIIGNVVVKDSIISNSDTICLLDQSNFQENYGDISRLLSINETEQKKIFTINKRKDIQSRSRYKGVYIRRGAMGEVYDVEVSIFHYLAFTTEKPEKRAVQTYVLHYGDYPSALERFVLDMNASGLKLSAFVKRINAFGAVLSN